MEGVAAYHGVFFVWFSLFCEEDFLECGWGCGDDAVADVCGDYGYSAFLEGCEDVLGVRFYVDYLGFVLGLGLVFWLGFALGG